MDGSYFAEALESRRLLSAYLATDSTGTHIADSATLNGITYYAADDGIHGDELWRSDGTARGTRMVRDIVPGVGASTPQQFHVVNGRILFLAQSQDQGLGPGYNFITGLWITDGTRSGTVEIARFPRSWEAAAAVVGPEGHQRLVFDFTQNYQDSVGMLWSSDGTSSGTYKISNLCYSFPQPDLRFTPERYNDLPTVGNHVVITGEDDTLWSTDGTITGTFKIDEPFTGFSSAELVGDCVVVTDGSTVWGTDGTQAGTQQVLALEDTFHGLQQDESVVMDVGGNHAYIIETFDDGDITKQEVWASDGTVQGSQKVLTCSSDSYRYLWTGYFGTVGNSAIFEAPDRPHHDSLWISDGTAAGTHIVTALDKNHKVSDVLGFQRLDGRAYFLQRTSSTIPGLDEDANDSLWTTDGTEAGTVRVVDLANVPEPEFFNNLDLIGNHLLLRAVDTISWTVQRPVVEFDTQRDHWVGKGSGQHFLLSDGVLEVFGASRPNSVRVRRATGDPSSIAVSLNGQNYIFKRSAIHKIILYVLPPKPPSNQFNGGGSSTVVFPDWPAFLFSSGSSG